MEQVDYVRVFRRERQSLGQHHNACQTLNLSQHEASTSNTQRECAAVEGLWGRPVIDAWPCFCVHTHLQDIDSHIHANTYFKCFFYHLLCRNSGSYGFRKDSIKFSSVLPSVSPYSRDVLPHTFTNVPIGSPSSTQCHLSFIKRRPLRKAPAVEGCCERWWL